MAELAISQALVSALSSCTQMEFPWSAGARSYTYLPWGWHRAAHRSGGHSGSQPDGGPALLPQIPLRAPTQGSVMARAQLQICPALSRSPILTALEVAARLPASTCMAHPSSTACPCPQTPAAGPGRHVGRRWQGHMGYTSPSPGMAAL